MLKYFYRLTRRKGAVLYAVIAIMMLLIAAAVAAYFTARTSYQTVVSNYDFSQTYLSATSISDMIVQAITQETSQPKDSAGNTVNSYKALKDKVQALKKGSVGDKIVGYSSNMLDTTTGSTIALKSDLLNEVANDPVEGGVLDAVKVEIEYTSSAPSVEPGLTIYYFTVKTTAYYRGGTIEVTDIIANTSGVKKNDDVPFDKFFTTTAQSAESWPDKDNTRAVVINVYKITDNAFFEAEYTYFVATPDDNQLYGNITTTGNMYLDKMQFHVPAPTDSHRNDWYIGGDLVISGSSAQSLDLNGNNIYIKGDLIISNQAAANITAGDIYVLGNVYILKELTVNGNLHVMGNIYNSTNGETNLGDWQGLKATTGKDISNVFVNWDGSPATGSKLTVNGGLEGRFVPATSGSGYVHTDVSYRAKDKDGNYTIQRSGQFTSSGSTPSTDVMKGLNTAWDGSATVNMSIRQYKDANGNLLNDYLDAVDKGVDINQALSANTNGTTYSLYDAPDKILSNELNLNLGALGKSVKSPSDWDVTDNGDGTYSFSSTISYWPLETETGTIVNNGDGSYTYTTVKTTSSGSENLRYTYNPSTGAYVKYKYDNDTAKWVVDSKCVIKDGGNTIEFATTSGAKATATKSGSNITVNLPYVEGGYTLGIDFGSNAGSGQITYNVATKADETMPILLKANFNDGTTSTEDVNGYNAFSWYGNKDGTSATGSDTKVQLVGQNADGTANAAVSGTGNVVFEVGNIATKDITLTLSDGTKKEYKKGEYIPYFIYDAYYDEEQADGTTKQVKIEDDNVKVDGVSSSTKFSSLKAIKDAIANGKTEEDKITYKPNTDLINAVDTPTYYEGEYLAVGTKNQVEKVIEGQYKINNGKYDEMINSSSTVASDPYSQYENRVMLVSNKNSKILADGSYDYAIDGHKDRHTLCGYVYTPNGAVNYKHGSDTMPVFGGLIVSTYFGENSRFFYASPSPKVMSSMLGSLLQVGGTSSSTPVDGYWTTNVFGKNYEG